MSGDTFGPGWPDKYSSYHYRPTEWVCILFIVLFSISTIAHTGQALRSRLWFLFPSIVIGGCGEIIGWGGRLWSSINLYNDTGFLIQISCTIISPTFLSAANFIILGMIINRLGPQYSRIGAKLYAIVFIISDVVALVIQAIGGGVASSASDRGDVKGTQFGGHLILAGIIVQLVAITIYAVLAGEFVYRVFTDTPVRPGAAVNANSHPAAHGSGMTTAQTSRDEEAHKTDAEVDAEKAGVATSLYREEMAPGREEFTKDVKLMIWGLAASTLLLFIRAIYRTIELSNGWNGRIISTQVYFNVLDGMMIVLAMYALNFFHPGWLLRPRVTAR